MSIKHEIEQALQHIQQRAAAAQRTPERLPGANDWLVTAKWTEVPQVYWSASLGAGHKSDAVLRVREFLAHEAQHGRCLILAGATGVGKTYAAVAGLRAWAGQSKHFFYFPSLCTNLLFSDHRMELLETAKRVRFVVFDALGGEGAKEGSLLEMLIDQILFHREGNRNPTLLTTNLSPQQFAGRLSPQHMNKLQGKWGTIHECRGPNLRHSE